MLEETPVGVVPAVAPLDTGSPVRGEVRGAATEARRVEPLEPALGGAAATVFDPATAVPSDAAAVGGGARLAMRQSEAT